MEAESPAPTSTSRGTGNPSAIRACGDHHTFIGFPEPPIMRRAFTVLELLVVVAILAALAGIAVSAVDRGQERSSADLVTTELGRIAEAVRQFRSDVGRSPKLLAELMQSPTNTDTLGGWWWPGAQLPVPPLYDPAIRRGWNGPYLQAEFRSFKDSDSSGPLVGVRGQDRFSDAADTWLISDDLNNKRLALLITSDQDVAETTSTKTIRSPYQLITIDGRLQVRFVDPSPRGITVPPRDCGVAP